MTARQFIVCVWVLAVAFIVSQAWIQYRNGQTTRQLTQRCIDTTQECLDTLRRCVDLRQGH